MKEQLLKNRRLYAVLSAILFTALAQFAQAQTPYFVENFDGNWSPTANGWNQTNLFLTGNSTPTAINTVGPKNWVQNKSNGPGLWTIAGAGTSPTAAVSDSGVLWLEDAYFGTTGGSVNLNASRVETPAIDLTTSTSPYVRFLYYQNMSANNTYPLILMASSDNGQTWRSIMRIQPNADVAVTTTTGSGTMLNTTPWQRITVKVPDNFKSANTKFAFYRNAPYSFGSNIFIDSLMVGEFTPATITSAQTGNWNDPNTWVGGVVPNADNHVVIAAGHTVTSNVNISRMQNLTVNGTFIFFSTSTVTSTQIFGNLNINAGATFNAGTSGSSTVGRFVYIGEGLNNSGTLNMGTSTLHSLLFYGGIPSVITNTGIITNGYISQVHFANSGGLTFSSSSTSNMVIRNTINLIDGSVDPNGKLTAGLSANSLTILRGVPQAFFTSRPVYPNLGTSLRSVTYGGGTNGNFQMAVLSRDTIFVGNETDSLPNGVNFIRGTLTLNTNHHVKLNHPLQVGDTLNRTTTASTTTGVGGSLLFTRGLLFTNATNILTVGPNSTGSQGGIPSLNTVTPPTTHGSYIVGPVRFVRPQAGTLTSTINVPLGLGSNYMGAPVINNVRRYISVTAGAGWAGQIVECELLPIQGGTVNAPQTALVGRNVYSVQVLENRVLPATSTLLLSTYDETDKLNKDALIGTQDQLFVMQSANVNGPWAVRSLATGTGAFVANTLYTRTTATTAPGPISGNGSFYTFATTVPLMVYDSAVLVRNTDAIAPGASVNTPMMRVNIRATGLASPITLSQFFVRTAGTGTASLAKIDTLKVWFTGNNPNFTSPARFGANVNAPGANITIAGSQVLTAGDNYFWFTYDINASSAVGDTFAIQIDSSNIGGSNRVFNSPAQGIKLVATPALYTTSALSQPITQRVGAGTPNQIVARLSVTMGAGAPAPLTNIDVSTNGTTSLADITNLRVYFTGTTNVFNTANQFGTTVTTPALNNSVAGAALLSQGVNYFWITYDIAPAAAINNVIDAEVTSITVNSTIQTPTVTAPAGNRQIRVNHCEPLYQFGKTDGDLISRVRIIGTTLDNNSGTAPVNPAYTYFTGSPNFTTQLVQGSSYIMEATIGSFASQGVAAWIDYNDDGVFQATERIGFTTGTIGTSFGSGSFPITLSCASTPGIFRMRVRCAYATNGNVIDPCTSYGYGEGEDYDVTILPNPTVFNSSIATQQTGTVAQNTQNLPVLRTPIRVTGCQVALLNNMYFRYSGTNVSDITSAKIYRTANSTFSTANLISTLTSPTTNMVFSMADSLVVNDTTWYWLAFDVSPTAVINNSIDAIYDSVNVINGVGIPSITNPTGNITILNPILYLSSSASHPTLTKAETNLNNQMLRVRVIMSSTGSPALATQLALSVNGSVNPLTNIDSITVWYTGSNPNFTLPVFFGGVGPQSAGFNVNGSQNLLPDTNYFWVNYRVPLTANLGDSIDAEISSITISGNPQVPTNGAPAGARYIRGQYCLTTYASGCGTDYVARVRLENLDNSSLCNGPYTYFNTANVPNLVAGSAYTITLNYGPDGNQYGRAWIDYNDDGDFNDPGEDLGSQTPANAGANGQATINFTVPCSALQGRLRLRIRGGEDAPLVGTQSCAASSSGYGEGEDYDVNIQTSPASYISSTTQQQTGTTSASTNNLPVLRIPVKVFATACQPGIISQLNFNTAGTTSAADIAAAKLYKTGNSGVFSTANLLGTVNSPSGAFSFALTDTAVNDTNFYWLTYDVSATALNNNVLDARFDSAQIFGIWYAPSVSNPAGNILISTPMAYISSTSSHPTLSKVETGTTNNQILRVQVIMSSTGAPVATTQLSLSVNGSASPLTNIDSIIVWYTGSNPNFTLPTFFGSTGAQAAAYTINGLQNLLNDTNYFWVTYRIPATAIVGDSVDAEITSITIASNPQTPTVTAPNGSRQIRAPYCASGAQFAGDGEIWNVTIGTLNNTSNCTTTGGAGSTLSSYSNYSANVAVPNIAAGAIVPFSVHTSTCGGPYDGVLGIWMDFNDDGDFLDAGEQLHMTIPFQYGTTVFRTGNITIPLNVTPGLKRMRVILNETTVSPISSCGTYGYGETEDYTVNILPAPIPTTYVWNQIAPGSFTTASNWTPSRVNLNLNDRLLFNNGVTTTVNDVAEQSVSDITVNNNTVVTLNAITTSVLNIWDSLELLSGRIIIGNNVDLSVGSVNGAGTIIGTGSVQGALTRWVNTANTNYVFPISQNNQSRTATINLNAPVANNGTIRVGFVSGNPTTAGLPFNDGAITVNKLAQVGLWNITTGNGLTLAANTNYDLSLTAAGVIGVTNLSGLTIARRNSVATLWDTAGTFVTATGTTASPVVNRGSLRVFGEFAIGTDSNVNPLPVRLIRFEGNAVNADVVLNWITANEQNNRGFYVERSVDGVQFERIGFVKGAGNSNVQLGYTFTDNDALTVSNKLYYRLRQVDFDNKYWLSNTVVIEQNVAAGFSVVAYPIPSKDQLTVSVQTTTVGSAEITIHDIQGRLVRTINTDLSSGENLISIQDFNTLLPGVYFMKVTQAGKNEVLKLIKQ
ncbi:MAG: BNR-repeat neuraminidase N-terminal domain-containing protein [Bacteroidota bacterium]